MSGSNNEITNTGGPVSSTEPSMEEILASIRRILKDEQPGAATPEDEAEDDEILVLDSTMVVKPGLDLGHAAHAAHDAAAEPLRASGQEAAAQAENDFEVPVDEPPSHLTSEPSEPDYPAVDNETLDLPSFGTADDLPSFGTAGDAHEHFESAQAATEFGTTGPTKDTYMSDESSETVQPPYGIVSDSASEAAASSIGSLIRSISSERSVAIGRPGLTLEDLVREELRPLLKSWLDSNLPPLVERIVRAEIQRVVERTGI